MIEDTNVFVFLAYKIYRIFVLYWKCMRDAYVSINIADCTFFVQFQNCNINRFQLIRMHFSIGQFKKKKYLNKFVTISNNLSGNISFSV